MEKFLFALISENEKNISVLWKISLWKNVGCFGGNLRLLHPKVPPYTPKKYKKNTKNSISD